jgi:hypothetical protein
MAKVAVVEAGHLVIVRVNTSCRRKDGFTNRLRVRHAQFHARVMKKKDTHADPSWKISSGLTPKKRRLLKERFPSCEVS